MKKDVSDEGAPKKEDTSIEHNPERAGNPQQPERAIHTPETPERSAARLQSDTITYTPENLRSVGLEQQEEAITSAPENPSWIGDVQQADTILLARKSPGSTGIQSPGTPQFALSPTLSPLQSLGRPGWYDASPLSIAVRRRRFLNTDLGRSIPDESTASEEALKPEEQDDTAKRKSTASLHTLESLEIIGGSQADFDYSEKGDSKSKDTKPDEIGATLRKPFDTPANKISEKITTPEVEAGRVRPPIPPKSPRTPKTPKDGEKPTPFIFPQIRTEDPRRNLKNNNLFIQRTIFGGLILILNIACLVAALLSERHLWVLIVILLVKAKDILSTLIQICWLLFNFVRSYKQKEPDLTRRWILACVTAYAETEVQIMRTINSIIDDAPQQHNLAMVVILDGEPQTILPNFTKVVHQIRRPYQTWRFAHNEVIIFIGFIRNIPVIMFEKVKNAGKKDSLILCHDLFDDARKNVPPSVKELRIEVWEKLFPKIIMPTVPTGFDYIFNTDADSVIHVGALSNLAKALNDDPNAIGACGLVLAEMTDGNPWSMWYLYQQFQYTFGQFVRRRAEGIWGRVTCLPGCVTMIKVRPEMAGAIELYAKPITDKVVFQHQVQYLGTDRRITWCMLQQSKRLKTLFVPSAISETVAPQSFLHYMSQRRRWGSNAFFNDVFYVFGMNSWVITRLWALIDIIRQGLVYYRLANTTLFIYGLAHRFDTIKLVPYVVVTQTPALWFLYLAIFHEPILRNQLHKLIAGWLINKVVSPILSILIFSRIILNLGNAVWGRTGASTHAASALDILHNLTPKRSWSPGGIGTLVRNTIKARKKQATRPSRFAVPVNPSGESVSEPATEPMEEKNKDSTTAISFASPIAPEVAWIPVNEIADHSTVIQRI